MSLKLSPWFNALKDKPVNGCDASVYEVKCEYLDASVVKKRKDWIRVYACKSCEWRGVLKEAR